MAARTRKASGVKTRRAKKAGKARAKRFTAWSYSRLKDYKGCPQRAKFKYLDKLEEGKPGKALIRGTKVHASAEQFLKGVTKTLDPKLGLFEDEFKALKKRKASAEASINLDVNWLPVEDVFAPEVWVRLKLDAAYVEGRGKKRVAVVIDFKTGRIRKWHEDQVELYGIAALCKHPDIEVARAELWYTDEGDISEIEVRRDELPELQAKWEKKVAPMLSDALFKPDPTSNDCGYCHFRKSNGGPCAHN